MCKCNDAKVIHVGNNSICTVAQSQMFSDYGAALSVHMSVLRLLFNLHPKKLLMYCTFMGIPS